MTEVFFRTSLAEVQCLHFFLPQLGDVQYSWF